YDHLTRIPGVRIDRSDRGTFVTIRGSGSFYGGSRPLIVVDDMVVEDNTMPLIGTSYLEIVSINNIAQIDVLRGAEASIFGVRGSNGVIVIHTKRGEITDNIASQPFHIKTLLPLGFQPPAEFYAPKYETAALRNSPKPDLRTTIHWQPVVQTNSLGEASFEFYTADEPGSYTVIIEGLCRDGQIIRVVSVNKCNFR
ncbi:MAG: TonB-dependent receptor plug domain-containing protein, partial [Bacteroidales bacterium]|nr:TonB-dependent receptor plug domain-containing protein [Bacteroidales bacterium]